MAIIVNEPMAVAPTTGTATGTTGAWNAGGFYRLTTGATFENAGYEYTLPLLSSFTMSVDFRMGTTSGADSSWFYFGWNTTPGNEGDAGGYLIERNIYGNTIAIRYNGTSLTSVTYTKDTNFDTLKVDVAGQSFTITYQGVVVLNYTDTVTRTLPGDRFGWGARSGGTGATQDAQNLLLTESPMQVSNIAPGRTWIRRFAKARTVIRVQYVSTPAVVVTVTTTSTMLMLGVG